MLVQHCPVSCILMPYTGALVMSGAATRGSAVPRLRPCFSAGGGRPASRLGAGEAGEVISIWCL
jgi:hypothetical protein